MKHFFGLVLFLLAVFPLLVSAQTDTVYVNGVFSGGAEGDLNNLIKAAAGDGTLSSKVFKLNLGDKYIITETITVPVGKRLTIVANDYGSDLNMGPAQILWTSTGGITTTYNFDCFGDLFMKNVWVLYANSSGNQTGTSLKIEDSPDSINGQHATFEGCLFDYSQIGADGSGAVQVAAKHFRGSFTNCYFRNCSDPHYRYYGRAVSFPFNSTGLHTDSLRFVNCTFSNLGYVIMQEGSEYTSFLLMNHCTFVNTVMFALESVWWHWLSITNSVFQNTYMFGDVGDSTNSPFGGTFAIDSVKNFGFSPPFTDADRHILFANSAYYVEPWLVDYMAHNPYSDTARAVMDPKPMPMLNPRTLMFLDTTDGQGNKIWPLMNRRNLYDGVSPAFLSPPTNVDSIKLFLLKKWTDNKDVNWAFDISTSVLATWPLSEVLRIPTSNPLKTAAMGGFPLGALFPWDRSKYTAWKAQEATENNQIMDWLTNGITGVEEKPGLALSFELSQNYPNPFNPTTHISYSVPQKSNTTLKVFNVLGMEVATLFSGVQDAGNHTATFDAAKFSSGVYFYRLQAGSVSITRKMLFVK